MLRRIFLALLLWSSGAAQAATVLDATGGSVELPEQITRVLPGGPPATILLAALAPDLPVGIHAEQALRNPGLRDAVTPALLGVLLSEWIARRLNATLGR